MRFAAAVNVEQINEIFPTLIERSQIVRQGFGSRKLKIILLNFIFLPAQIFDGFAFAGRKTFNQFLAGRLVQHKQTLLFTALDELAIRGQHGNDQQKSDFANQRDEQRNHALRVSRRDCKARQSPKIDRLLDGFFSVR